MAGDEAAARQAPLELSRLVSAELREKGSRFVASLAPAATVEQCQDLLAEYRERHRDATHVCSAWRVHSAGQVHERASDDGEPAGTAGQPMLRVLQGSDLCDVVALVVRWYGGTKLGKGGLARAYAGAVRAAVEAATEQRLLRRHQVVHRAVVEVQTEQWGALQRLIQPPRIEQKEVSIAGPVEAPSGYRVELQIADGALDGFEERLSDLGLRLRRLE